jgi:hypothetical protein
MLQDYINNYLVPLNHGVRKNAHLHRRVASDMDEVSVSGLMFMFPDASGTKPMSAPTFNSFLRTHGRRQGLKESLHCCKFRASIVTYYSKIRASKDEMVGVFSPLEPEQNEKHAEMNDRRI